MIDRALYKAIKNMNREEMNTYLNQIQVDAYNNGVSAVSKEIAERVDVGIRKTPGIGEKRYKELIDNINAELNRKSEGSILHE